MFLADGNFLYPTCLSWVFPLAERHRVYAPDVAGQPGRSAQERSSPKGDGHAFWVEDVFDGLGLGHVPLVGLSYGAGLVIRTIGLAPEHVSQAALVSPPAHHPTQNKGNNKAPSCRLWGDSGLLGAQPSNFSAF